MVKIVITVENYHPELEYYPDAKTERECLEIDAAGLNEMFMSVDEFLDGKDWSAKVIGGEGESGDDDGRK